MGPCTHKRRNGQGSGPDAAERLGATPQHSRFLRLKGPQLLLTLGVKGCLSNTHVHQRTARNKQQAAPSVSTTLAPAHRSSVPRAQRPRPRSGTRAQSQEVPPSPRPSLLDALMGHPVATLPSLRRQRGAAKTASLLSAGPLHLPTTARGRHTTNRKCKHVGAPLSAERSPAPRSSASSVTSCTTNHAASMPRSSRLPGQPASTSFSIPREDAEFELGRALQCKRSPQILRAF